LSGSIDSLLELVAAFCLGEVDIQFQEPVGPAPERTGASYELAD
jgi:hypothetical protein